MRILVLLCRHYHPLLSFKVNNQTLSGGPGRMKTYGWTRWVCRKAPRTYPSMHTFPRLLLFIHLHSMKVEKQMRKPLGRVHRKVLIPKAPWRRLLVAVIEGRKNPDFDLYLFLTNDRNHQEEQNRRFPCDKCPKKFVSKKDLIRHENGPHGGKKHRCFICDSLLSRQDNLARHMRSRHKWGRIKRTDLPTLLTFYGSSVFSFVVFHWYNFVSSPRAVLNFIRLRFTLSA